MIWFVVVKQGWQVLLPLLFVGDGKTTSLLAECNGWCYCHGGKWNKQPWWVYFGRCYCHVWLMELPHVSIYFNFGSEVFNRTSSQICSRWYLPIFLFRDGLLTIMYRASLMVLMRFWSSLLTMVNTLGRLVSTCGICFTKEIYFHFLVLQLVKVQSYITPSCSFW